MNKTEFIKKVAEKNGSSVKDASALFDSVVDVITEALKDGEKINLTGFATIELRERPARDGINPMTGEKVKIAACLAPTFKFSKSYRDDFKC